MKPLVSIPVLLILLAGSRTSALPADSTGTGCLTVRSATPGVRVLLDTVSLGIAPVTDVPVPAGEHLLRFVQSEDRSWLSPAVAETLRVAPGERIDREAILPTVYHITSEPYGATVTAGGTEIGLTPLELPLVSQKAVLTLSKAGFEDEMVPISGETKEIRVLLRSKPGAEPAANLYLSSDQSKAPLPVYLAAGTAIASGFAAAYLKIKADNVYDDYRQTGDPASLDQVRRLDLASGISLGLSEISLLTLTWLLFSR